MSNDSSNQSNKEYTDKSVAPVNESGRLSRGVDKTKFFIAGAFLVVLGLVASRFGLVGGVILALMLGLVGFILRKTGRAKFLWQAAESDQKVSSARVLWGPWAGIVYAGVTFVAAQFLAASVLYAIAGMRGLQGSAASDWLNTVPLQFAFILCAEALTFGAIWWFLRFRGASLRTIGYTRPRWQYLGWALGGFAVYFAVYVILYSFVARFVPGINVNQEQDIGFKDVVGVGPLVLTFVSLVILPPIVEETVFRGFIFTGLRSKYPFILAAIVTSALFAVAHLEFGNGKPLLWIAAIDTFTLSMVMCYVREKTGSIVPTILIHAIKNCVAFMVLYVFVS